MALRKPVPQIQLPDFENISDTGFRWLDLVRQYSVDIRSIEVDINPPLVAANDTINVTVTVPGIRLGDLIIQVIKPTTTSGLVVAQGIVTADDTAVLAFVNNKSGGTDDPLETYTIIFIKNSGK